MLSRLNNLPNKYLFYFGLIFVFIFISLSYWQFTSYLEEKKLSAQISYPQEPTEVLISQINTSNEFSLITTQERLKFVNSWLLRSRVNNGMSGYHVISIFKNDMDEHILINRGWVPLSADVDNYTLNPTNTLASLTKTVDGKLWQVDYLSYQDVDYEKRSIPLPSRIRLTQGDTSIKLIISTWTLNND